MKNNQDNSGIPQPNNLAGQTSPYLLQHLYNPVNWYPWSEEALEKAVREDKPIIVSIGYSACHWCHVMENESFEDREVAEMMNNNFICIKVDREERPDIDHLYMTAVQLLTRQGGWPLNCFALPDTRPFWGGTYFPKNQWKSILMQVTELYKAKKNELTEQAEQLTDGIAASGFIETVTDEFSFNEGDAGLFFQNVMNFMDSKDGGTLRAPKFPLPVNHEFLLHYYYHTIDISALSQVELSLEKMALGGIYDQIGGGFARYSTDEKWKVPHFEKMLYDNGQLLSIYSNAWKISKNPLFKEVVYQTIEFLSRELTSPQGTFYSALDADSEGEEGKFYIWTEEELDEILGGNSPTVKTYYGVGGNGLWEKGWNILLRSLPDDEFTLKFGVPLAELQSVIQSSNQLLLKARAKRTRPSLDNKVITSWNALAIKGLSDAYAAFGNTAFLDQAKIAADFIIKYAMDSNGKVYRCLNGNKPSIEGFLEDYAQLIQSLIRLFEVSMQPDYLLKAKILTEYVIQNFSSKGTSLFSFSSNHGKTLKAPFYELPDNVIPSSNSVMAVNLFYMANYFEKQDWAIQSTRMLNDMKSLILQQSINYSNWGRLLLHHVKPFYTLVITGPEAAMKVKEVISRFIPGIIIAGSDSDNSDIPLLRSRYEPEQNWYYVCSQGSCKQPVKDLQSALDQMM